jgi:hypothetical protein
MTAVTFVVEIRKVRRFDNPRQLKAHLGLAPSEGSGVARLVRSIDASIAPDPPPGVAALVLEFSLGDFLQDDLVDCQLRHRPFQPRVL